MGTRGAIGFIVGGVTKVTYRHFDSYPSVGGKDILNYISGTPVATMQGDAARIVLVKESDKPTAQQISALKKFADTKVGNQTVDDWYCLLRNAQGDLAAYAEAGVMIDSQGFLKDSLFCEWAYIINLDSGKLEVYRGFNKNPKAAGRYAKLKEKPWENSRGEIIRPEYNGVVLIEELGLDELRAMFAAASGKFSKAKPEEMVKKLTDGWERIADDQREAEDRVAKEKDEEKALVKKMSKRKPVTT